MNDQQFVQQQLERLQLHRRTLAHYLAQQARLGGLNSPPEITNAIIEARENIRRIKEALRDADMNIEDDPDDGTISSSQKSNLNPLHTRTFFSYSIMILILIAIVASLFALYNGFISSFLNGNAQPINSMLLNNVWNAFNGDNYATAITNADKCINRLKERAVREQSAFTNTGIDHPSIGKVSENEKENIFSRGTMNDVATCYYIKGQALEKLNRIDESRKAYEEVLRFPDARTWDLSGFFWSPAQAASQRLAVLP